MIKIKKYGLIIFLVVYIAISMLFLQEKKFVANATSYSWSDPATIIKVTDENRELIYNTPIDDDTTETYDPDSRRFQSMASIEVTGERIWAAWTVGGDKEPHPHNYIVLAYSDDQGATWIDPFIIIDHDDALNSGIKVCVPNLWLSPQGELWCFYVQAGTCVIVIPNPEATPEEIQWTGPRYIIDTFGAQKIPTVIIDDYGREEWLICAENGTTENGAYLNKTSIFSSTDKGKTWKRKSEAISTATSKRFHESQILELKDKTLWMLSRIENGSGGGVEQSFSYDRGVTWTDYVANLGSPLISPGSKFHIERLPSGNLLWITNLSTATRTNLMAFLSKDDGKTWSHSLTIDDRTTVAYPDAAIDSEGNIYVIYDRNRSIQQEIRMSVFNESDIIAGEFISDVAKNRILISKNHEYKELISLKTQFDRRIEVSLGTASSSFLNNLPTNIVAVDEYGEEYTLTGTWSSLNYNKNAEGIYKFRFNTKLPDKVEDAQDLLSVTVKVADVKLPDTSQPDTSSKGCRGVSMINFTIISSLLGVAFMGLLLFKK